MRGWFFSCICLLAITGCDAGQAVLQENFDDFDVGRYDDASFSNHWKNIDWAHLYGKLAVVEDDAQGELQGIFASVTGVALILSPITMTGIFKYFTSSDAPYYMPGAPFLAAAVLEICAMALLFTVARKIWGSNAPVSK